MVGAPIAPCKRGPRNSSASCPPSEERPVMPATPVWRVGEWSLTASLDKIEQQWGPVRELLEDERLFAMRDGSVSGWSCGEHAGHIALVTKGTARFIVDNLNEPQRNIDGEWTEHAAPVLEGGDFPRGGAKAPPQVDPVGRGRDDLLRVLGDATHAWQGLRSQEQQLKLCPARAPHFGLGYLTSSEWVRFCAIHTAHHLAIVRDIRNSAV